MYAPAMRLPPILQELLAHWCRPLLVPGLPHTEAAHSVKVMSTAVTLPVGRAAKLPVVAYDAAGVYIDNAPFDITLDGLAGTFDTATGTFTPTGAPGTGKIIVSLPPLTPIILNVTILPKP